MSGNVSSKKMQAIEAMLTGMSLKDAAASAKINPKTLSRWLSDPGFQTEFREARRQVTTQGNARIIGLMDAAIDAIKTSLDGGKIGKERFLAAKLIIETVHQIATDDLLERIEALEARFRDQRTGGNLIE